MLLALAAALLLPFHLAGQTISGAGRCGNENTSCGRAADARVIAGTPGRGFQGSLNTAIAARDARTAGKILNQIGELWLRLGNSQNALEAYNKAVAAARLAQDAEQGVTALNGLGNVARAQGKNQEALQAYQRALDVATAQGVAGGKGGVRLNAASAQILRQPESASQGAGRSERRHWRFADLSG